jgi:acetyl-CoA synthetase
MLTPGSSVEDTRAGFQWNIPAYYNIGVDVCDRPCAQHPERIAITDVSPNGDVRHATFSDLKTKSNQLAAGLSQIAHAGDRIAVLLPQSIETALCHIAIAKAGCIALPLFTLFGPDALLHRLKDSGARVVFTNAEGAAKLRDLRGQLPVLEHVFSVDGAEDGADDFAGFMTPQGPEFTPVETRADDPALLIYTSGTTGSPKGALHAHRVLLGHLPGVEMSHDFLPQPGDCIWTPADWAWIGGLLDVLMPALHHGVPVIACRFRKFTAKAAFDLMEAHNVKNAFLPPTALKMMRVSTDIEGRRLNLRSVASGGEPLGKEMIEWARYSLGATINEFYGQAECNMIVSSCASLAPPEPGVMGFAVPGHDVEVLREETGQPADPNETGDIAVSAPDPVMFLEYWKNPDATQAKFRNVDGTEWLLTGDKGYKTPSGRIAFVGRDDDVITSSGYRIGPAEIEDCLLTHPAVQMAGVVGQPDPVRGHVVAAFVQLIEGYAPSENLAAEIADHVRARLAAYEAPRVVEFIDQMPLTTTGKIIRANLRRILLEKENPA